MIPRPRRPTCLRHHVWMAACGDCHDEHMDALRGRHTVTRCPDHPAHVEGCDGCAQVRDEEKQAAQKRLDQAAR